MKKLISKMFGFKVLFFSLYLDRHPGRAWSVGRTLTALQQQQSFLKHKNVTF